MPLSVDCACPGAGIKLCDLASLSFVVSEFQFPYGLCELRGGPSVISITASGEYALTPTSSWLAALDDLYVWAKADRSLHSDVSDGFKVKFRIEAAYVCEDADGNSTETTLYSVNRETALNECVDEDSGTMNAFASIASGSLGGAIIHSSPLASCYGFEVQAGDFEPLDVFQVVDVSDAETPCFCASGGTEPYRYMITKGYLPHGQSLDSSTGCVTGTPTGAYAGSERITVEVMDSSGAQTAEVSCKFIRCNRTELFGNDQY